MTFRQEKTLISIIVPVYNVEKTLERCLQSIARQGLDDYELILVDDGSPDNSGQICDEWSLRHSNTTVIHKENGGLSDARNAGIDAAKGRYLTFVDSDDYIEQDTLATIVKLIAANEQIDMIEYSVREFVGGEKERMLNLQDTVYTDIDQYWLKAKAYTHTYAWNKIYKCELFNGVRFPKGKVFEDVYTLPLILRKAKTIATTSRGHYVYCWNKAGITSQASGREMQMLLEAHLPIVEKYIQRGIDISEYYLHVLNIQITTWRMNHNPYLLPYYPMAIYKGMNMKSLLKMIGLRLFGMKFISMFYR